MSAYSLFRETSWVPRNGPFNPFGSLSTKTHTPCASHEILDLLAVSLDVCLLSGMPQRA